MIQALGRDDVYLSVTSIELVRGVLATAHAWVAPGTTDKDLWRAYRAAYGQEPFVRIVHERGGIYRHPEPKLLAGTNLADVGWELDPQDRPAGGAGRHRQPGQRRRRHRRPVHEPDVGLGRDGWGWSLRGCIRCERNCRSQNGEVRELACGHEQFCVLPLPASSCESEE